MTQRWRAQYGTVVEEFYEQIDQVLGEVLPKVDDNTTLLVLSDHGFAPYRHSFNLNTWLLNNGYITRKEGASGDASEPFSDVDWSRTRAYGLGLNGLYLNMRGREREGIVDPEQADALLREIRQKLLEVRDPKDGSQVITRIDLASEVYQGPYARSGAGCAGRLQSRLSRGMEDDSGCVSAGRAGRQHECVERRSLHGLHKVPGVLLSNRKIDAQTPALTDIAPTILAEFGIAKTKEMKGQSVFQRR